MIKFLLLLLAISASSLLFGMSNEQIFVENQRNSPVSESIPFKKRKKEKVLESSSSDEKQQGSCHFIEIILKDLLSKKQDDERKKSIKLKLNMLNTEAKIQIFLQLLQRLQEQEALKKSTETQDATLLAQLKEEEEAVTFLRERNDKLKNFCQILQQEKTSETQAEKTTLLALEKLKKEHSDLIDEHKRLTEVLKRSLNNNEINETKK